jgi:hypothetical protein
MEQGRASLEGLEGKIGVLVVAPGHSFEKVKVMSMM